MTTSVSRLRPTASHKIWTNFYSKIVSRCDLTVPIPDDLIVGRFFPVAVGFVDDIFSLWSGIVIVETEIGREHVLVRLWKPWRRLEVGFFSIDCYSVAHKTFLLYAMDDM